MRHRNSSSLRALLLLLLAAGPLQAQTVFACAMMDTVMHDACCCDDHNTIDDCVESKCGTTLEEPSEDPCCERSVEVTVDQDAIQGTPTGKVADVRSDVDPPQALVSSIDAHIPSQTFVTPGVRHLFPAAGHSGSDTYLVTQRLRI